MHYTPVPVKSENRIADACYSCMPHTLTDVSNQLANGVEIETVPVEAPKCFQSLPAIDWVKTKNSSGVETIQLTPESVNFWLKSKSTDASEHQQRELNITLDDFKIFNDLQNPLRNSRAFAKCTNGDKGNASQMVRYEECMDVSGKTVWYTNHRIPVNYLKLGIAFGFGHFEKSLESSIPIGNSSLASTTGVDSISTYMRQLPQPMGFI